MTKSLQQSQISHGIIIGLSPFFWANPAFASRTVVQQQQQQNEKKTGKKTKKTTKKVLKKKFGERGWFLIHALPVRIAEMADRKAGTVTCHSGCQRDSAAADLSVLGSHAGFPQVT